jgi:hypothetical protein
MKWERHSWVIILGILVVIPLILIILANTA